MIFYRPRLSLSFLGEFSVKIGVVCAQVCSALDVFCCQNLSHANSGPRFRSFKGGFISQNSVAFARRHPVMGAVPAAVPRPMAAFQAGQTTPIKVRQLFPETFLWTNLSRF